MDRDQWVLLVPEPIRRVPVDLAVVAGWVVLTDIVLLAEIPRFPQARVVLGFPFVVFAPGYALTAALLPGRGDVGPIERLVLSVGTSLTAVPLAGLALHFSPWGVRPVPVIVLLSLGTVVTTLVALARRRTLPPEDQFTVTAPDWLGAVAGAGSGADGRLGVARVGLVVLVVVSVVSLAGALALAGNGESFTAVSLLAESPTGELVADGYPSDLAPGEEGQVTLTIGNHEGEPVTYSVVVTAAPLQSTGTLGPTRTVDRLEVTVEPGATRRIDHAFTPPDAEPRQRITYLVYRGEPPTSPSRENAYRAVHFWVTVGGTEGG